MKILIINGSPRTKGVTVGIKPFVMKKGDAYRGVLEKWERMGIG